MVIGPAVRLVRQVQIAMLVTIALYAVAGERLAGKLAHDPANALFLALSFISISIVGATVVIRRLRSGGALENGLPLFVRLVRAVGHVRTHSADVRLYAWQRLGFLSGRRCVALAVFSASAAR